MKSWIRELSTMNKPGDREGRALHIKGFDEKCRARPSRSPGVGLWLLNLTPIGYLLPRPQVK